MSYVNAATPKSTMTIVIIIIIVINMIIMCVTWSVVVLGTNRPFLLPVREREREEGREREGEKREGGREERGRERRVRK